MGFFKNIFGKKENGAEQKSDNTKTEIIKASGIMCDHCKARVEDSVKKVCKNANVEWENASDYTEQNGMRLVIITYSGKATRAMFEAAIEKENFTVEE